MITTNFFRNGLGVSDTSQSITPSSSRTLRRSIETTPSSRETPETPESTPTHNPDSSHICQLPHLRRASAQECTVSPKDG
jgi:hypothetical protein